jgi:predicted site-specific integrase-resolvase
MIGPISTGCSSSGFLNKQRLSNRGDYQDRISLLADQSINLIVVEHKDRGTRFGFRYIETLLKAAGREIEVVNQAENGTEDLQADLISIISSFCARIYGQRRAKRKTEKIVAELEKGENDATD